MHKTDITSDALEAQLARFPHMHRERLRQCAKVSRRVAELAFSHPLLYSALATHYGPLNARLEAVRRAELGRPLADVSDAIGLPTCLKRIPPEACVAPLTYVRWTRNAARLVGQQLPDTAPDAARWLKAAFYCARVCDEAFALWACRQTPLIFNVDFDIRLLRPLALFVWHARQPENPLHELAFRPWSPNMGFRTAVREAKLWLNRVKLYINFHETPITDSWVGAGSAGGFDFIPLVSCRDILEEGTRMRNCLHSYADRLARNACRLFSVRQGGRRIATLELAPPAYDETVPLIAQLKGPDNTEAPRQVWRAAQTWIKAAGRQGIDSSIVSTAHKSSKRTLQELLVPYRRALGDPSVPGSASDRELLPPIEADLAELARWTRVSGWPFRR